MENWFGTSVTTTGIQAHGGSQSLSETGTGTFWGVIQNGNINTIPLVPGHHYFFSAWVRAATTPRSITGAVQFDVGGVKPLSSVTDSTTGWTQMTGSYTAPAGSSFAIWLFSGTEAIGETHYFDDLVTTDLSSSSAISDLELGSTNAQVVTLGNMNEIGSTTINGGSGITMNSGQANYTVNGGAINITGAGASLYQTTAGALDITAADTSTWQVGAASSGNGGDLTIHAGDGAFGGNDGGNLILQGGLATGANTGGSVIIKPQTDSADAFIIQDSLGAPLLTADTTSLTLTISGHLATNGSTPTSAQSAAADCSGTGSSSILGNDTSGTVTITTGVGPCSTTGMLATITFANAFGTAPRIILTPAEANASTLQYYNGSSTTSNFTVDTNTNPTATTTYKYNFWIVQ
jgi:hypothetical protein